ncbi:polysaccharide pyruvyl transferase family protein [Microvirga sp. 2MCAF38]|uniref:polysaccharide pyruvyl transferase family protein n=1 Tax=Microvirga sp. 2MCAF38 TaxID=3232989 RepID=UPI003F99665A
MGQIVGLTAATLTGNHGAEAMLSTVIGRLRERNPDLKFVIFSYYPGADRRILSAPGVEIVSSTPARLVIAHLPSALLGALLPRAWRRRFPLMSADMRRLSECSVLVDLAGVSFIDGREKFLPFNVLTILPAMMLNVAVVKVSQASGPFKNWLNRLAARLILPRCAAIHARGARTHAHLMSLGLENVTPAADAAFLLADQDRLVTPDAQRLAETLAKIERMKSAGRTIVGICPSSVVYAKAGQPYIDALAALIEKIEAAGHGVVFVPNATRADDPERLRNNDIPVIRRLVEELVARGSKGERVVIENDIDAVSIKHVIDACDVMIVSRFHAMVGALALAKPTVVFGWSHKYAEVMHDFGMGEWVFDYTRLDADAAFPRIADLIANRSGISRKIADSLPHVKAKSAIQIDAIHAVLSSSAR